MNIEQIAAEQFPAKAVGIPFLCDSEDINRFKQEAFIPGYHYAQQQRRWVSVSERLPLKKEANRWGQVEVIWRDSQPGFYSVDAVKDTPHLFTHWRTPEKVEL